METKPLFYDIYDLKSEDIPSEEEWSLRMEEVLPGLHEPQCMNPPKGESEEGEGEDPWADEVNVKVTTGSNMGAKEVDEVKGTDKKLLKNAKVEL